MPGFHLGESDSLKKVLVLSDLIAHSPFEEALNNWLYAQKVAVKIFFCEGVWVWDPYDSLIRTLLFELHRDSSYEEVWIIGCDENKRGILPPNQIENSTSAVSFIFRHVKNLEMDDWCGRHQDFRMNISKTVNLLEAHPFLPKNVNVKGFVYQTASQTFNFVESNHLIPMKEVHKS